ncbi:hypothetical protein OZD67_00070 [Wolbachia endosymbiont of Drosophila nikananu]|nr:hypothetical protein [Wolbachia endosymbiont of Drosophila nikananu]MDE5060556.1 hypothetical protein [Wolbachia endosymbiont of Drosophila nikananu]
MLKKYSSTYAKIRAKALDSRKIVGILELLHTTLSKLSLEV